MYLLSVSENVYVWCVAHAFINSVFNVRSTNPWLNLNLDLLYEFMKHKCTKSSLWLRYCQS